MKETMDEHFNRAASLEAEAIEQLKGKGVAVADCDRAVFRERVHPMWDRFVERAPGAKDMLAAIPQTEKA
jgi:TRAP-type transport system periplasmic protein